MSNVRHVASSDPVANARPLGKYCNDSTRVHLLHERPVAPPGGRGGSFPLWADVQKLCNMCVLSLSRNFFVSHDKYIARPSSKEPRCTTGSTYSITERRIPEPIPVLGSQPARDVSHKPGGRLPLLSPGLQLPPQPLRGLLPILLLGERRYNGCEQFA